jgi:hypothetical protein
MGSVQHLRGTRAALDALALGGGLLPGQIYVLDDEDRIAVANTASTYTAFAKESEAGGGGGGVSAGLQLTNAASFNANTSGVVPALLPGPSYGSGLSVSGLGILCSFTGVVRLTASLYFTGSPARGSVALQAQINGTGTGPMFNQSYVRNSGGHNENGTVIPGLLLDVAATQIISVSHVNQAANGTLTCAAGDAFVLVERVG